MRPSEHDIAIGVTCEASEPAVIGSHLPLAVGRHLNTADLILDRARVAIDGLGSIRVDE